MQPSNNQYVKVEASSDDTSSAYAPSSSSLRQRRDQQPPLRAIAIGTFSDVVVEDSAIDVMSDANVLAAQAGDSSSSSGILQVMSAAPLVTGSTVGAGMLILPSLASGPGFAISSALFLGIYWLVLTSGLVIADVAINQHESGYDVPSSFQEFAEANLESEWMAKGVSAIPVAVNSLVLVFAVSKAGDLGSSLLSPWMEVDPLVASAGFLGLLGACLSTLSGAKLSTVASMCVTTLLVAFGGLLLPGLASVQDPMATLMAPGLDGDQWFASVAAAAPIVLTALQFQNVVPSLTKILKFDRQKTVAAIALGSFLPLAMYLAWCFAVLGGGIDSTAGGIAGPLMTVFSATTLFGSSIGASMSVTEEVETFVSKASSKEGAGPAPKKEIFSLPAVLLSLAVPMAGIVAFSGGNDASAALGVAGAFGSPILYGVIPAMMSMNQRKKLATEQKSLVPGGLVGVGALGLAAAVYVGEGLASHVTEILS